jgi:isopenicillin N synthase-like dioxygenase
MVQPRDDTMTVSICDALSMVSCQQLKSTIHSVHAPPADQSHLDQMVFYTLHGTSYRLTKNCRDWLLKIF